jgi:hypothetical protein
MMSAVVTRDARRDVVVLWGAVLAAAAVGVFVSWHAWPTVAIALAAGCGLVALVEPALSRRLFLAVLGMALVGYATLGRGFAYIPSHPPFVGDIVLVLGIWIALLSRTPLLSRRITLVPLAVLFAAWGALRTLPYLHTYGAYALRDAAVWGYAAFAFLVSSFLLRTGLALRVPRYYGRFMPWILLWWPFALVTYRMGAQFVPDVSSGVKLIELKPGDTAVHLAGAACFLVLQIGARREGSASAATSAGQYVMWVAWLLGFLMASSSNRGGLVAVAGSLALVFLLRPIKGWWRLFSVALVIGLAFAASGVKIELGRGRDISMDQLSRNVGSVLDPADYPDLAGTVSWRIAWWKDIVDYTLFGKYFWTGKGFGVNLADDDGFQVSADHSLRSPHNGHLTILAREGVPGLLIWLALQGAFAASLLRACVRSRRLGNEWLARVNLWVLAYWLAFMINGGFDVFLEGPQGGIWFWSLFGFGIALLETERWSTRPPQDETAHLAVVARP